MSWLPHLFTSLNLASGVGALILTCEGRLIPAAWLILFAVISDGLDGRLARRLGVESAFGRQFDSLADFISFGLAAGVLFYSSANMHFSWVFASATVLFVFSSAFRLIRFNQTCGAGQPNGAHCFEGLPTTAGGGLLASLVLAGHSVSLPWALDLAVLALLAFLMASRIPYPSLKQIPERWIWIGLVAMGGWLILFRNFLTAVPLVLFLAYVLLGELLRSGRLRELRSAHQNPGDGQA